MADVMMPHLPNKIFDEKDRLWMAKSCEIKRLPSLAGTMLELHRPDGLKIAITGELLGKIEIFIAMGGLEPPGVQE